MGNHLQQLAIRFKRTKVRTTLFLSNLVLFWFTLGAQNVGIGTVNPTTRLDVNSTDAYTTRFNGPNQMYIGISENQTQRGYIGSFSGGVEDLDMGTSTNNLNGKFHLTTKAQPRLTIDADGKVGIGNLIPSEKLDIAGNLKLNGEIKPNGVAGTNGQVLTSNGNGTMQWASMTNNNSGSGNGGWGDCSIYNIDSFQAVSNVNPINGDYYGSDVAISGDYAVVGARGESIGFTTVNTGSVTFLKFNQQTSNWESLSKVFNTNSGNYDNFGCSVAMWGDYAVVGANNDDESGFFENGSASVYKRNSSTGNWDFQTKLINGLPASQDYFGTSVAIYGDYIIVGSSYDDEGGFTNSGSATIFKRNSSTGIWESQGKLTASNPGNEYKFGFSVAIYGDYAVVGAPYSDYLGSGSVGSANIFKRNAATGVWEFYTVINPSSTGSQVYFGISVAMFGENLVIGAYNEDNTSAGVLNTGSVTIYKINSTSGALLYQTKFFNSDLESDDAFGFSVSLNNDYLIIGCPQDNMDGNSNAGSCTIMKKAGSIWLPHQKFSYPSALSNSNFGLSVAIDPLSSRFIIGAIGVYNYAGASFFGKAK